jgi:transcriptional regulator with XRE-family HTH domain
MTFSSPIDISSYARALGLRIEQERTGQGMSKEDLAERSGLASRYIWRCEEGLQNITLKSLVAIAHGLQVSLATLMQDVEKLAADPPPKAIKKPRGPTAAKKRALAEQI